MNVAGSQISTTNTVAADRNGESESPSDLGGITRAGRADQRFSMQRLSLDAAVAPLLPKPTAPFDKTERKRAHTSALYYSECFLRGIKPLDADSAAKDAQDQYDKWWIDRTARNEKRTRKGLPPEIGSCSNTSPSKEKVRCEVSENEPKRRRISTDETSMKSSNVVSVTSGVFVTGPASTKSTASGCDEGDDDHCLSIRQISILDSNTVATAKTRLNEDLKATGGDVETLEFTQCVGVLEAYYKSRSWDCRGSCKVTPFSLEGNWLTLSKPTYDECKGRNEKGDLLYTLGRMSFGMFRPMDLECSVQASFNNVRTIDPKNPGRPLHVPKKLMKEIQSGNILLRTYDIVVAITIEPGKYRRGMRKQEGYHIVPRPIKGILTNTGYGVPDPNVPNRLSIWFSGGALEVQDEPMDLEEWKKIFDTACAPERNVREYANILAARLLLGALLPEGMEEDGSMTFDLKKPIGGHGCAYCDIVYMDDDLRIMRGHHGSVYVFSRVPEPQHIYV